MHRIIFGLLLAVIASSHAFAQFPNPKFNSVQVVPGGSGAQTADGGLQLSQNTALTAFQIYGKISPSGYFNFASTRSVADCEIGTSVTNCSAYDAYVFGNVAHGTGANAQSGVGYLADVVAAVDHAHVWAANFSGNDSSDNSTGTSNDREIIGNEFDFTVSRDGGTVIEGISMEIQGPGTPETANAFQVSRVPSSTAQWSNAYISDDGASVTAMVVGAAAVSGSSIASQPVYFNYFTSGSVERSIKMTSINDAMLFISTGLPDGISIGAGNGNVNIQSSGSSAAINLNLFAKGAGGIFLESFTTFDGGVQAANLTGGTPTKYVCADVNSVLSLSATPC